MKFKEESNKNSRRHSEGRKGAKTVLGLHRSRLLLIIKRTYVVFTNA